MPHRALDPENRDYALAAQVARQVLGVVDDLGAHPREQRVGIRIAAPCHGEARRQR